MLGNRSRPRIPLPKQWPSRFHSGVLHAISLAHFSLTFARSVAANNINARIRLKAENSRLRQEISILIEEARIKDSRMERIPTPRRPPTRVSRGANDTTATCLRPTRLRNCGAPVTVEARFGLHSPVTFLAPAQRRTTEKTNSCVGIKTSIRFLDQRPVESVNAKSCLLGSRLGSRLVVNFKTETRT